MNNQAGKGDSPRPVNKKTYNSNYEEIAWKNKESGSLKSQTAKKTTYIYKN
jgi:hypothetical protein